MKNSILALIACCGLSAQNPTGTVLFYSGETLLGSGTLTCTTATPPVCTAQLTTGSLPVGASSITAVYSGDTNYAASTSPVLIQTVNAQATVPPPVFMTSFVGTVGVPLSLQFQASNSPTFSAAGLPPGLSLSASGLLSGTPTVAGVSSVTVTATNSGGTGSVIEVLTINPGSATPAPTISSFVATPASITSGQSSSLSWAATNATSFSLSGIGAVASSPRSVSPATTTTYTLTATGPGGSATASATVTVTTAPPTGAPTITSITSPVASGATVTITGTGFLASNTVYYSANNVRLAAQTTASTNGTTIIFKTNGLSANTYGVYVYNTNGSSNFVSLVVN